MQFPQEENHPKKRKQQLSTVLKKHLGKIVQQEIAEGFSQSLISIADVVPDSDLSSAKVFISILGGHKKKVVKELQKREPYLRHLVGKEIQARRIPKLKFILDETLEEVSRIEQLLKEG